MTKFGHLIDPEDPLLILTVEKSTVIYLTLL